MIVSPAWSVLVDSTRRYPAASIWQPSVQPRNNRNGAESIHRVIGHPPLILVVSHNHAFGRQRFVFERSPEQDAFITPVRRAGQFAGKSCANKFSRQDPAER